MTHEPGGRSGGQLLVDQLAVHGADLAFGVPGESYIDVLDALRDSPVSFVTCRHAEREIGAVHRELVDEQLPSGATARLEGHSGTAIGCSR